MTSNLSIPTQIKNTLPKPTKAQLIEALLDRARKAHDANEKEKEVRLERLEAKCTELMLDHIKNLKESDFSCNLMCWRAGEKDVQISAEFTTKEITAIKKQIDQNQKSHFHEEATKKKIVEGLKAPNPLLDNTDVTKALDNLLTTIMNPTKLLNTVDA